MGETHDTVRLSQRERDNIVVNALRKSGYSREELETQARDNRFEILQAKLSWMVISANENK